MPIENFDGLMSTRYFPGMAVLEGEILRRWLSAHYNDYDRVEFNVRLGDGEEWPDHFDDALRAQGRASTQKRADLVAWKDDQPTIVEVKRRIGFGALGQLLGYRVLWGKTYPDAPVPALIAVGETAISETPHVYREHGVQLELV